MAISPGERPRHKASPGVESFSAWRISGAKLKILVMGASGLSKRVAVIA
jgi:hypothetical protein